MANMGEDGMKKFSELLAAAIETSQHNLFAFTPSMSYPRGRMDQGRPGFLEAQGACSPQHRRKAEEKPAQ